MADIRPFRQFNPFSLPADRDGAPTWQNLLADLRALLEMARPEVLVMPHPQLDPHPDHICAQAAVIEALQGLDWQPQTLLCYANHLHDNDRWPMGDSGDGVALPPQLTAGQAWAPCALLLDIATQRDKAMALGMMHDLQPLHRSSAACVACCSAGWQGASRRLMERTSSSARPCAGMNCSGGVSCKPDRDGAERPRKAMKVLFLVQKEQRAILDRLYDGVAANCECDLRWLTSEDQRNLRRYFKREVQAERYDRIVFFLRFKQEIRQAAFIRTVPNLVILEHDAYQNYIPCKYTGKFSAHYRKMPWARVISSGYTVSERLRQEGFDAVFVPKGYDEQLLADQGRERDIELAFVGSTNSVAYSGRKALLDELGQVENLVVTRTKSGEDYCNTLNRIQYFVSADVGMGEYMIKNFEAMACGCVLLAYDQGEAENRALGLQDMHNVVFMVTSRRCRRSCASCAMIPSWHGRSPETGVNWRCPGSVLRLSGEASSSICSRRSGLGRRCLHGSACA